MAKRMLKCYYCGEVFDANSVSFAPVSSRRYAHQSCIEQHQNSITKEQRDKEQLEKYIKELFNVTSLTPKMKKQIDTYVREKRYSYSGIYKTLKYFFEIKGNSIEKSNNGIGIVPYVYDEAFLYWRAIWETKQKNEQNSIDIKDYPVREVHIFPPQREPLKHFKKQFTFLDSEVSHEK